MRSAQEISEKDSRRSNTLRRREAAGLCADDALEKPGCVRGPKVQSRENG